MRRLAADHDDGADFELTGPALEFAGDGEAFGSGPEGGDFFEFGFEFNGAESQGLFHTRSMAGGVGHCRSQRITLPNCE